YHQLLHPFPTRRSSDLLIRKKLLDPLIIVAIANMGEERIHEYSPTRGVIDSKAKRKKRSRGLARQYGRFLVEELKPYIDRKYRRSEEHTSELQSRFDLV